MAEKMDYRRAFGYTIKDNYGIWIGYVRSRRTDLVKQIEQNWGMPWAKIKKKYGVKIIKIEVVPCDWNW